MTDTGEPIYDVSVKGYGTGFDLSLDGARAENSAGYRVRHYLDGIVSVHHMPGLAWPVE